MLPPAASLALLQQGNHLRVGVLSITLALAPDGLGVLPLEPAYLDGSSPSCSRAAVDLHTGQVLLDRLLESVGRAAISSRATVLNINFVGHK